MLMENGTKALFNDFVFQNNVGGCLPQQHKPALHHESAVHHRGTILPAHVSHHPAAGVVCNRWLAEDWSGPQI